MRGGIFGLFNVLVGHRESPDGLEDAPAEESIGDSVRKTAYAMLFFSLVGAGGMVLFSKFPHDDGENSWLLGAYLLIACASGLLGGFVGFLFGIPKVVQDLTGRGIQVGDNSRLVPREGNPVPHSTRYLVNTNLEEVSDWLTKMLVGIGLTQLLTAPGNLWRVCGEFADDLKLDHAAQTGICALVVYFLTIGFLTGYLMTRLYLSGALARADGSLQAERVARKEGERVADLDILLEDLSVNAKSYLKKNWDVLQSDLEYALPDTFQRDSMEHDALRELREKYIVKVIDGRSFRAGRRVVLTALAKKIEGDIEESIGVSPRKDENKKGKRNA